jgi:hypothetical protein
VAWLGAFPQERQNLWLPKDDLQDHASWSSPPLVLLRDIHSHLIAGDCKDKVPPKSQPGERVRVGRSQQDGDAQQQQAGSLLLPAISYRKKLISTGLITSRFPNVDNRAR